MDPSSELADQGQGVLSTQARWLETPRPGIERVSEGTQTSTTDLAPPQIEPSPTLSAVTSSPSSPSSSPASSFTCAAKACSAPDPAPALVSAQVPVTIEVMAPEDTTTTSSTTTTTTNILISTPSLSLSPSQHPTTTTTDTLSSSFAPAITAADPSSSSTLLVAMTVSNLETAETASTPSLDSHLNTASTNDPQRALAPTPLDSFASASTSPSTPASSRPPPTTAQPPQPPHPFLPGPASQAVPVPAVSGPPSVENRAAGAAAGYPLPSSKQRSHPFGPPIRSSTLDIRRIHPGSLLLNDPGPSSFRPQQEMTAAEPSSRIRQRQIYRRNTFSAELGSTSFQRSDDEMEMDELEEARRRMEALKKSSSRRMSKRKKEDDDRVLIGTRIGEDHVNYVLMYNMLTGIRVSVSRCNAKPQRALVDEDFTSAHKLAFDITGNELTPSSKYDFKFKDYAPWVFRHLREDFHIDASDYLVSLTSKYILSELGSPGKSGSFFYFSQDYRFIIKTIHHAEHKFMRKILRDYFNHVKQNPHTLLCRFFGLHRVKLPHGRKIHFVVMGNVFPPNRDIHETYDLKGSTLGRAISDEELSNNPRATQKDLNWVNRNRKLELGPEKRHLFVEQTKRDVELLSRLNIMDYSLLIGIHDIERGNRDNIRDNTLKVFQPEPSKALTREPSTRADKRESKVTALRKAVKVSDPVALSPTALPSDSFSDRRHFLFYADDGGLLATGEQNEPRNDLYYLGIIDILTPYNYVKKIEHVWKSLSQDKHAISAVNPREYASRFLSFIVHAIKVNGDVLSVLESKKHPHRE